jgi:hypothetical protein
MDTTRKVWDQYYVLGRHLTYPNAGVLFHSPDCSKAIAKYRELMDTTHYVLGGVYASLDQIGAAGYWLAMHSTGYPLVVWKAYMNRRLGDIEYNRSECSGSSGDWVTSGLFVWADLPQWDHPLPQYLTAVVVSTGGRPTAAPHRLTPNPHRKQDAEAVASFDSCMSEVREAAHYWQQFDQAFKHGV